MRSVYILASLPFLAVLVQAGEISREKRQTEIELPEFNEAWLPPLLTTFLASFTVNGVRAALDNLNNDPLCGDGFLCSPNYSEGPYPGGVDMTWTLKAPAGKTIKLLQLDFAVYTDYDVTDANKAKCKDYIRLNTNEVDFIATQDLQKFVYKPAVHAVHNWVRVPSAETTFALNDYPADVVRDAAFYFVKNAAESEYEDAVENGDDATTAGLAADTMAGQASTGVSVASAAADQAALDAVLAAAGGTQEEIDDAAAFVAAAQVAQATIAAAAAAAVSPSYSPPVASTTSSICGAPQFPEFHLELKSKTNEMTIKFHSETGTNTDKGFRFLLTDSDGKNTITITKSVTMN